LRAVLIAALSTGHKLGLGLVALVFVLFALGSAMLIPRYRPEFPGKSLRWFVLATVALFVAMMLAVEFFAKESEEAGATENTAAAAEKVAVTETEFKIALAKQTLGPGEYEFDVKNDGKIGHDLVIDGPGVKDAKTPVTDGGQTATLKVKLESGTYEFYCSVPGHKEAGMDLKVTVS
jgi:uncharacterized cupredoxin-like copper-binding protein